MTLKEKLAKREVTIGSWMQFGNPLVAEVMAKAGFDWLTVDMEHSATTIEQAISLIQVIELCGCAPLVRLSANNPTEIKHVMDAGAHGVIVPNVKSPQEAEAAVSAVYYPPRGTRGVGLWRAQGYGASFESYCEWQKTEPIVIAQIEHHEGVAFLEGILKTDGIDGFIIGPYDLSASLGVPGQFDDERVVEALAAVEHTAKRLGALMGMHVVAPDASAVLERVQAGYRFIACGIDTLFLGEGCRNTMSRLREAL
jgi:2-keto-3-deoxy-L-rhamnonate aldolase RhmA